MNTHHISSNYAVTSDEMRANVNALVHAEALGHYDEVKFMRAHVSRVRNAIGESFAKDFLTVELDNKGARVLGNGELAPLEIVLEIKRDTVGGRPGVNFYRGCLAAGDLVNTADNTYTLFNKLVFDGAGDNSETLVDVLNRGIPNGLIVLPTVGHNPVDLYRAVYKHRVGGVGFRQANRRYKTVKSAEVALAKREANKLTREAYKVLGDGSLGNLLALAFENRALLKELFSAFKLVRAGLPLAERAAVALPPIFEAVALLA
jgi:hypothetical protein